VLGNSSGTLQSIVNDLTLEVNTLCPLFLLTFENFNYNVHNYLVDSGASVNVIPLLVSMKINVKWEKTNAKIIQLDRSLAQDIDEIKNVLIRLPKDARVD